MPENNPKKKVTFSENDAASITQRYDTKTLLTLFQELSNYPDTKFDWNELVNKTSTGISNAREYQMLWRCLAYGYSLPLPQDFKQGGGEPMDDDSDLDCELESFPSVHVEAKSESSACAKVIIASRTLSESTPNSSTIEAPMTVNFPIYRSSRTSKEISQPSNLTEQTSITFPVTVQRQKLRTVSATDALETKRTVGGTTASKRKRKEWSEEEDNQLRAAVQRCGEGNWVTMAKGDSFPIKRSATELSQVVFQP
ncbi:myb-like DNA-binding domain protein [Medicago truncatula]|uniref:Myb-like DNA-binding domain protein n=1 Tax=Medicago truncatula TaxID=3880 RepID=A0A072TP21_MEDTR|nr:myb-like DNA-binding domain protein [Medicago truncatula]